MPWSGSLACTGHPGKGLVDASCYLGLGRVFTANMTGNVVLLAFGAAGAPAPVRRHWS